MFLKKIIGTLAAGTLFALSLAAAPQNENSATMNTPTTYNSAFPLGEENVAYAQFFTGKSWLSRLTKNAALNAPIANVTFAPGCRNNWHSHTGGQILIATDGVGFYQEKGSPARRLVPGDVVEIAPNVVHWHGAAPSSNFSHLAIECNPQTNKNTWLAPVNDAEYYAATLAETDPEFAAIFAHFAGTQVPETAGTLDARLREIAVLSAVLGTNSPEMFRARVAAALDAGLAPETIKEILYQGAAYLGFSRILENLNAANAVLRERGIALPLAPQGKVSSENRSRDGNAAQIEIFGDRMRGFVENGPADRRHIREWLAANCFGDYYTRDGMTLRERELTTFCFLASLGGCEPQLKSHIAGNLATGNDRATLIAAISHAMPYIGYPRTLNALAAIDAVAPESH